MIIKEPFLTIGSQPYQETAPCGESLLEPIPGWNDAEGNTCIQREKIPPFHPSQRRISGSILEQSEELVLLQDSEWHTYHLFDSKTGVELLTTSNWAEAYHFWLRLRTAAKRKVEPFGFPAQLIAAHELLDWLYDSQQSPGFGQLLYRRDRQFRGLLQYSVQLSETMAICWSPSGAQDSSLGQFLLEPVSRHRCRPAQWLEPQPSDITLRRLQASVNTFHQKWDYRLFQFNSEHWARLVTEKDCSCFQEHNLQAFEPALDAGLTAAEVSQSHLLATNLEAQIALEVAIAGLKYS